MPQKRENVEGDEGQLEMGENILWQVYLIRAEAAIPSRPTRGGKSRLLAGPALASQAWFSQLAPYLLTQPVVCGSMESLTLIL